LILFLAPLPAPGQAAELLISFEDIGGV
jgi:hypothetical protein